LYGYLLEYAASLMNKPTVSFTDTTSICSLTTKGYVR
jgi:hypothetical protein